MKKVSRAFLIIMGLRILLIGDGYSESNKSINLEFELLALFVKDCFFEKIPSALGKCDDCNKSFSLGSYSHIHILRGMAISIESKHPNLVNLSEKKLEQISLEFYQNISISNRFIHLLNHPDNSGFYIPYHLTSPRFIQTVYENTIVSTAIGSSYELLSELELIKSFIQSEVQYYNPKKWSNLIEILDSLLFFTKKTIEQKLIIEFL